SDCNCRENEKFVDLFSVCPAIKCEDKNSRDRTPTYWIHSKDGCQVEVSNQAREKQYKETDDDSFLKALAWSLIAREDNKDNNNIKPVLIELNT
ncbi:22257_t:CDS:2, partial [Racocetra persica]